MDHSLHSCKAGPNKKNKYTFLELWFSYVYEKNVKQYKAKTFTCVLKCLFGYVMLTSVLFGVITQQLHSTPQGVTTKTQCCCKLLFWRSTTEATILVSWKIVVSEGDIIQTNSTT